MSSEQAEAAKAIVKDPEGWGDFHQDGTRSRKSHLN